MNRTDRTCTLCRQTFPATVEHFYSHPHGRFGLQSRCKRCHSSVTNARSKRPEVKARRRLREKGKTYKYKRSLYTRVHALLGNRCTACQSKRHLEIHHIHGDGDDHRLAAGGNDGMLRHILGGEYDLSRLELLCHRCHMEKDGRLAAVAARAVHVGRTYGGRRPRAAL